MTAKDPMGSSVSLLCSVAVLVTCVQHHEHVQVGVVRLSTNEASGGTYLILPIENWEIFCSAECLV